MSRCFLAGKYEHCNTSNVSREQLEPSHCRFDPVFIFLGLLTHPSNFNMLFSPLIIIIIIIMYLLINNFISHFFVLIDRLLVAFGRTQWAGRRFWDLLSFGGPLLRFLHLLLLKLDCPSYSLFALSWGLVR